MRYFTILQYKLHSFNIQDDRSTREFLSKLLKKFPKSPIRPAGSQFWLASNLQWELSVWMNINTVTLQHNKELMFIFYLMVLERCIIFKSLDTRGIKSTPTSNVHKWLKTKSTTIKIATDYQQSLLFIQNISPILIG